MKHIHQKTAKETGTIWLSPTTVIAVVSVAFSLAAIIVSIKSCTIAEKALDLSNQEFSASRSAIYRGVLNEKNDELSLSTIDSNIQMQYGAIHLPPQLDKTVWNISPPDFKFPLIVMRSHVEDFLDKKVTREKGYVKVIDQTSIPLIIGSSYIAKGQPYLDMSLYQLVYIATISDGTYKRPTVTFKGLIFGERLPMNTDPQQYLRVLWETPQK